MDIKTKCLGSDLENRLNVAKLLLHFQNEKFQKLEHKLEKLQLKYEKIRHLLRGICDFCHETDTLTCSICKLDICDECCGTYNQDEDTTIGFVSCTKCEKWHCHRCLDNISYLRCDNHFNRNAICDNCYNADLLCDQCGEKQSKYSVDILFHYS